MKCDKVLIEENSFQYEEFIVKGELYKIALRDGYGYKESSMYCVELEFEDSEYVYNTTNKISPENVRKISKLNLFVRQVLCMDTNFYDSIYDFVVESVINGAREARNNREQTTTDIRKQSEDKQANMAFESLKEI